MNATKFGSEMGNGGPFATNLRSVIDGRRHAHSRTARGSDEKTVGNSHVNEVRFGLTCDMKDRCVASRTAQSSRYPDEWVKLIE